MIDIVACGLTVVVILFVFLRKTSAGVAILALLAGVLLDQLLSGWIISFIPNQSDQTMQYLTAAIHLGLTFIPAVVAVIAVRVGKHHIVPSLLASIALGFLITFFGTKIVLDLTILPGDLIDSGLLIFLQPYQNAILAASAFIAVFEMTLSYKKTSSHQKHQRRNR